MSRLGHTIIVLTIVYTSICALAYAFQDNLLFFPRPNNPTAVAQLAGAEWTVTNGKDKLTGWLRQAPEPRAAPLVFYFGGNAQDIAVTAAQRAHGANTLYVNYRGYGTSTGNPSEQALLADALVIHDAAVTDIPHNGRVLAHGRSLGSGVATYLAAQRPLDGVVLVTPYDSIINVAKGQYWFLPVSLLLQHRFDSAALAVGIDTPAMVLIAGRDRVVPPAHALALVARWRGPTQVLRLPQAGHTNITRGAAPLDAIAAFVAKTGGM